MNRQTLSVTFAVAAAFAAVYPTFAAKPVPGLTPAGSYSNEYKNSKSKARDFAEIVSVSEKTKRAAITIPVSPSDAFSPAGSSAFVPGVEVLNLAVPTAPTRICRVATPGAPTSVAIHPTADYFLVVIGEAGLQGSVVPYRASTCAPLVPGAMPVGIQPDSVIISPSGNWAAITNEAESPINPDDEDLQGLSYGGDGSISLIDLRTFNPNAPSPLMVSTVSLPLTIPYSATSGYSFGRFDGTGWLPIDNSAKTLEPESITFDSKEDFIYFTLQENNAIGRMNLQTRIITYFPAGRVDHTADTSDDGAYNPDETLQAFREPDGIGYFTHGNRKYIVTADEGDTAEGYDEEPIEGPRGGRTVTVFNAETGEVVGDTGNQLDAAVDEFLVYDDGRSDRGGVEPEVLDITKYKGRYYVAVGLERAKGVALVDLTDPAAPEVISVAPVGNRPEGVKFYQDGNKLYVLVGNEEGVPTLSVLLVD